MSYHVIRCPFTKRHCEMTAAEAKAYYRWFMQEKESRMQYLRRKCAEGLNCSIDQLDYSRESLVLIWRYFLSVATIEDVPLDVPVEAAMSKRLIEMGVTAESLFGRPQKRLTAFTELLLIDIGMYYGETLVRSNPCLKWELHRKKDVNYNKPVIGGFVGLYNSEFHPKRNPLACGRKAALVLLKNIPHNDVEDMLVRGYDSACCELPVNT